MPIRSFLRLLAVAQLTERFSERWYVQNHHGGILLTLKPDFTKLTGDDMVWVSLRHRQVDHTGPTFYGRGWWGRMVAHIAERAKALETENA